MHLFLEAIDVWLFRDGQPFDALSDHRAESLFPPYPTVIQGVIRSHHLVVKGVNLQDKQRIAEVVGTENDYKDLRIRGPFLARRENGQVIRYLPQPADAVTIDKEHHKLKPASLPRPLSDTVLASSRTPYLLGLDDEPVKGETGLWLAKKELLSYLAGQEATGVPANEFFQKENRIGIGRDDRSRTTKEGALYEVEFIRPCSDTGLLVEVNGYEGWPHEGILRAGGEGRGAYFRKVEVSPWPLPPETFPPRFKIYFAAPTYYEGGWQPSGGNWGKFFEGEVELVAAALNRYESVGGYDWANNRQKPARRYVPAGSVYYFISKGKVRLKPGLIQNAITDLGAEIGFGQILVKEW
ncbi:MAG: type III-B CRISPR module-associated protein Cmr3 [Bacillota bacterium]|nr:type III-B CRISPR module-associated protein Cmr3 [Bacillota bacterium]